MSNRSLKKVEIIDLGLHPFADTFIARNRLNESELVYPLKCYLSSIEGHISNLIITNDNQRYNEHNYSYTSSNSAYARKYWKEYSVSLIKDFNINSSTKILEIGSNDGFLLKQFHKTTKKIIGIDASKFMCKIANNIGVKTYQIIFNKKNSEKILFKNKKMDIIIANNVLTHANNLEDFIEGIKNTIKIDGVFIFEAPYWLNLVMKKRFDQIYHEHINYLTVKSCYNYLKKSGFEIFKIILTKYHGGSLRVYAKLSNNVKMTRLVKKHIQIEDNFKIFKKETYSKLMSYISLKRLIFMKKVISYKIKGYKIIGIGAAAKANTFLNYMGFDKYLMDFITDSSKYKIGKFTPNTRIPIVSDNCIKYTGHKVIAIPLAWNIENFLKKKIFKLNKNIKFLKFYLK